MALISIGLVGLSGSLHYLRAARGMTLIYLRPENMPNMHGLLLRLTGVKFGSHFGVTLITIIIAIIAFVWISKQEPCFATAILILPVTTAYLLGYDLTLLLLPIVTFELWGTWTGSVLVLAQGPYAGFTVLALVADLIANRVLVRRGAGPKPVTAVV